MLKKLHLQESYTFSSHWQGVLLTSIQAIIYHLKGCKTNSIVVLKKILNWFLVNIVDLPIESMQSGQLESPLNLSSEAWEDGEKAGITVSRNFCNEKHFCQSPKNVQLLKRLVSFQILNRVRSFGRSDTVRVTHQ